MLTKRKEDILRIIVDEYISTAAPVSSESIAHKHQLGVSPATIRNEMADLEESGYITQPHPSAGRVPSDGGYRYYVESFMRDTILSPAKQLMIRHQFHQVGKEFEEWAHLMVVVLSRLVQNMALVTMPKATQSRFKHLELVSLQDFLVMLILILEETRLKPQMVVFDEAVSQEELSVAASMINAAYTGLTALEIRDKHLMLSPLEQQVMEIVMQIMQAEDEKEYDEPYLAGLHHIFSQPEFAHSNKILEMTKVIEDKSLLRSMLSQLLTREGIQIIIGSENREDVMRDCSVVVTRYGIPGEVGGALGVIGPTRMQYEQVVSTVRYMASLMSELVGKLHE